MMLLKILQYPLRAAVPESLLNKTAKKERKIRLFLFKLII